MKKIISVFLALVLCLNVFAVCAGAEGTGENSASSKLSFNSDGSFKIIQVADFQDNTTPAKIAFEYVKQIAEEEKPDLFILTGDNISESVGKGYTKANALKRVRKAIDAFMSVFEEIGVPVAVLFGNHDAEGLVSKEEQMAIYMEYDCCVAVDEGESLYGCGTYNLPIYSSDGKKIAYNIWLFDSNMYDDENGGYDYVHEDQVEWYVKTSEELKKQNDGEAVPSMVFQHIIVKEVYDALTQVEKGTADSVSKYGNYYTLPEGAKGSLREAPCPATVKGTQFEAMVAQGDVKAMFFGHDHSNDFEISYKGIDIVNTPTSGFGSYGSSNRGVRVITLDENDTSVYETEMVTYLDHCCTSTYSKIVFYIDSIRFIWDMALMGITIPIKAITNLFD